MEKRVVRVHAHTLWAGKKKLSSAMLYLTLPTRQQFFLREFYRLSLALSRTTGKIYGFFMGSYEGGSYTLRVEYTVVSPTHARERGEREKENEFFRNCFQCFILFSFIFMSINTIVIYVVCSVQKKISKSSMYSLSSESI